MVRFCSASLVKTSPTSSSVTSATSRSISMSSKPPTSIFGSTSSATVKAKSALRIESLLDFLGILGKIDLRVHGKPQLIVLDNLPIGLVDRVLDDLGHDRAAIETLEVRNRDLARAKAGDARLGLDLGELAFDPFGDVGGGQHHLEFALEAFASLFA